MAAQRKKDDDAVQDPTDEEEETEDNVDQTQPEDQPEAELAESVKIRGPSASPRGGRDSGGQAQAAQGQQAQGLTQQLHATIHIPLLSFSLSFVLFKTVNKTLWGSYPPQFILLLES